MEHSKLNGMEVASFEDLIAQSRERYLNAVSDALDAEIARFVLIADRVALIEDFAKFACFMAALKIAEVRTPATAPIAKNDPLRAWWPVAKQINREVAAMLLEYGREAERAGVKGTADAAAE